jgi:muramoyltetrapeptide carboxypeptidase
MQPFPPIPAGSRVALVAPAGPLRLPNDLDKAVANAKTLEWEPVVGKNAGKKLTYFAGSDEARIADFNAAIRDDGIAAIWCLRGGYGAMRLLDHIDWAALKKHPKAIIGFSDITALHCAAMVKSERRAASCHRSARSHCGPRSLARAIPPAIPRARVPW